MKNAASITIASGIIGLVALGIGYCAGTARQVSKPVQAATSTVAFNPKAVENIVRNYLLQNPELMLEVQTALETKQAHAAQEQVKQVLAANQSVLFDPKHDAVFGNPNGDVTVYEFFDYNCGYCKRALPDMEAILKKDPNVRYVLKEFPILGPDSMRAHVVSQAFKALMPEKYPEFHEMLLGGQGRATEESAIADAVKLGADEARLREKMKDPAITGAFQRTYQLAQQLNITGTPSYVIGEELVPGAIGIDGLRERIAAARDAAKK
ncbi:MULTISPECIES: DsbA family protein [unclassified Brucella]|uniref:DsbA family protein n=1 Tax=unclassified Brucella TaxID=2632610 RepID=UPI00097288DE|nr:MULTISPECIES: DsbA family protein [unclassified Brucella]APX69083.1 disulfide bond formation protein DsbA [Brucella sp. 09RB8471]MRN79424.1 thioredoxin domain-containing protein [Brucella sp. 10RB9210]